MAKLFILCTVFKNCEGQRIISLSFHFVNINFFPLKFLEFCRLGWNTPSKKIGGGGNLCVYTQGRYMCSSMIWMEYCIILQDESLEEKTSGFCFA